MIVIKSRKDCCGLWSFTVSAGDDDDLDVYCMSEYEYETREEAEMAAVRWIVDEWHVL